MEITINIPKNDYVQPTEVRPHVVQAICEAFLAQKAFSTFHPHSEGCYRQATLFVCLYNGKGSSFHHEPWHKDEQSYKFNGAEMRAAFKALRDAGYHIFKRLHYGSWLGYEVRKRPYDYDGGTEVYDFTDFID